MSDENFRVMGVSVCVMVRITLKPDTDAITRVTGPEGDEWRAHMYAAIKTEDDVCQHFAYNAVRNGVVDACQLDGWADLKAEEVTMEIVGGRWRFE